MAVRIWRLGEDRPAVGHTVNLSPGGMFIGTSRPPRSGERVRVEVVDPERGFVVEAVVTHSHDVPPELRKIKEPGMGVRFLQPEELIRPVTRPLTAEQAEAPASPPEIPPVEPEVNVAVPAAPNLVVRTLPPAELGAQALAGFAMRFASKAHFLDTLRRDMQHGGLFLPTSEPATLNQVVLVELEVPTNPPSFERCQARVVHRATAQSTKTEKSGIGVEFLDRNAVVARLRRLALSLEAHP